MDNISFVEQSLRAWMEDKNLEMRDALDANDAEVRAFATRASMVSNLVIT